MVVKKWVSVIALQFGSCALAFNSCDSFGISALYGGELSKLAWTGFLVSTLGTVALSWFGFFRVAQRIDQGVAKRTGPAVFLVFALIVCVAGVVTFFVGGWPGVRGQAGW
jgi:hypothetical protein